MIGAILPAGGRSRRMGRPKLLLPWRGHTVLEQVILTLQAGGVERTLAVVTPELPELATLARQRGADALVLPEPTPDMRATVEAGLAWAEHHWQPAPDDAWFLVPADHPALEPAVIRALLRARQGDPAAGGFVPTWEGQRGHPALIAWAEVAALRALPAGVGLNAHFRAHPERLRKVPVATAAVLADLDTPEDYRRWLPG
jgi:molybdenum cofactor cytidylyltransferase